MSRPGRDKELDGDLENYLRETPERRSARPPAEVARLRKQMAVIVVARRQMEQERQRQAQLEEMVAFERQAARRREEAPHRLGRVSDSGLHEITPLDVAEAARKAMEQLQIENDALKERERQKERHKLYTDVVKFVVCLLIGGAGTLIVRLIRLH